MSIVSLELAKAHMKVDGNTEDELISLYIEAAEEWCGNYMGRPVDHQSPVPADLKIAVLKLVSFYYEFRNIAAFGVSVQLAPHGVTSILDNYREEWFPRLW